MNNLTDYTISNTIYFGKELYGNKIENNSQNTIINHPNLNIEGNVKPIENLNQEKMSIMENIRNKNKIHSFNKISVNSSAPQLLIIEKKLSFDDNESKIEEEAEKVCKICFDTTITKKTGKLIAPCKCAGSVKYIHEECLKTWLVSQNSDLNFATCELCHKFYKMEIKIGLKFFPKAAFYEGLQNVFALLCLIIFFFCLLIIIILFSLQWYYNFFK